MNPFGKVIKKEDGSLDTLLTRRLTKIELEGMTVVSLRNMCTKYFNIPGMSHKKKNVIVDSILKKYELSTRYQLLN